MIRTRNRVRGGGVSIPTTLVSLPALFTARWTPSFNIYETGSVYSTDFDFDALKPSGTTMYVAKTGNDTTGDGSSGNPYRTFTKAYAMGATIIMVKAGIYDRGDMTASFNPTRSLAIISADGAGKAVLSRIQAGTLSWTQQISPNTDVYLTSGISNARTVLDTTYTYAGEYMKDGTTGLPKPYTLVASVAACQALAGSYYQTGTSVYVHTWDGRAPDTNVKVLRIETNWSAATADITIWSDGMEYWGDEPMRYVMTTTPTSSIVASRNCGFRYGGLNASAAMRVNGINFCYSISCECSDYLGNGDGFNYHNDAGANTPVKSLEVNCTAKRIGKSGDTNDNGTTSHDNCLAIRIGGSYTMSYGPVSADVLGARCINLGGSYGDCSLSDNSGQDTAIQSGTVSAIDGLNTMVWAKNCTLYGANNGLYAAAGGTLYDWGNPVNTTTLGNTNTTPYP